MRARDLRTERERTLFVIAAVVSALAWILIVVTIVGALYGAAIGLFILVAHALFLAHVSMNGVRLGPDQLPELHAKVQRAARELGMDREPEAYVLSGDGMLNAFATKLLSRRFVIVLADLVHAAEACAEPDAPKDAPDVLDFVIAHEVGHLAAGHLAWNAFLLPGRLMPWLGPAYSRACEYTCDRCGQELVKDLRVSGRALAVLAAGATARHVSLPTFTAQRQDSGGFWASVLELNSSHPFLPKRIAALEEAAHPGTHRPVGRNPLAYPLAPLFGIFAGGMAGGGMMMVAMFGIIAAIAVPNFMNAVERGKAKRTMTDIRELATAVESRAIDVNRYPEVGSLDELAALLEPTYVAAMPRVDGWGRPLAYEVLDGGQGYVVGSAGKDGEWDSGSLLESVRGETTDFDSDIVFANGEFVRYPSGSGVEAE